MAEDIENPALKAVLAEEEESDRKAEVRRAKKRLKSLGMDSSTPKATNFPKKGDNKEVLLSNSKFNEFPFATAKKIQKTRRDLWGKSKGSSDMAFRMWSKAKDDVHSPAVKQWIKRRERWAEKHRDDKLTPAKVMAMIKNGVVSSKGKAAMMRVIGLTESGAKLREPGDLKSSKEED